MPQPRIFYLAPDHDVPSWGVGMLYHHVRLLRAMGFDALVLHERSSFRMSWIDVDVPIAYLTARCFESRFRAKPSDLLIVPEVLAHSSTVAGIRCRKIVFVQGSFLMLNGFSAAIDYRDLGYEAAIAVMPHIRDIVCRHFGLVPAVIPPFIASYFFAGEANLDQPRPKRILLAGKAEYRKAGYLDFDIASKILQRFTASRPCWELLELSGFDHHQTAQVMMQSSVLVNVNSLESFNAIVPEAMAAGCLPFCYEAYGGRDYLKPGVNAFVWPNNYIYPLLDDLLDLLVNYDDRQEELTKLRKAAYETAAGFRENRAAEALAAFYGRLVNA